MEESPHLSGRPSGTAVRSSRSRLCSGCLKQCVGTSFGDLRTDRLQNTSLVLNRTQCCGKCCSSGVRLGHLAMLHFGTATCKSTSIFNFDVKRAIYTQRSQVELLHFCMPRTGPRLARAAPRGRARPALRPRPLDLCIVAGATGAL